MHSDKLLGRNISAIFLRYSPGESAYAAYGELHQARARSGRS